MSASDPFRFFGWFIAAFVVLGGLLIFFAARRAKQRQAECLAWATARGWTYTPRDRSLAKLAWGPPFGTGSDRDATDVLTGPFEQRRALCFTYTYETSSSNGETTSSTKHYFAIYALATPRPVSTLQVGREGVLGRLARAVGLHDIEFESEEFNKRFKVRSDDRKLASDVLHPRMMQWLLDNDAAGFVLVDGQAFIAQRGRLELAAIDQWLGYLEQVIGQIPEFVWNP